MNKLETLVIASLFGIGFYFRVVDLSWLPGINGDEAWYGNLAWSIKHGSPLENATVSGNVLNPFLIIPHLLLTFFEPSFFLLRIIPVIYGVLTAVVGFFIFKSLFDLKTAWLLTLFLFCLPINIAYSRFNWDPSLSLLATLLFISSCIKLKPLAMAFTLFAMLLVHPTNIFVTPMVVIYFLSQKRLFQFWLKLVPMGLALGLFYFYSPAFRQAQTGLHAISLENGIQFFTRLGDFLFGPTIYYYISGYCAAWLVFLVEKILTPFLCVMLLFFIYRKRSVFGFGLILTLIVALFSVGDMVFSPHTERYGLFVVAPFVLVVGEVINKKRLIARLLMYFACAGLLFTFHQNYFMPLRSFGGSSHLTFQTSEPEPKSQVYDELKKLGITGPILVYSYWLYQPLTYLDQYKKQFEFIEMTQLPAPKKIIDILNQKGALVFYSASMQNEVLQSILQSSNQIRKVETAGHALIRIIYKNVVD